MPAKLNPKKETKTVWPPKFLVVLATIFLAIWIIVGLFFLMVIVSQIRQGFFKGLFAKSQSQPTASQQPPQEANLPGIGKVNIDCVQKALSSESIQKILQEQSSNSLSDDDKAKLDTCVLEKAQESPQPSPTS